MKVLKKIIAKIHMKLNIFIRLQSPFILIPLALIFFWLSMGFTWKITRMTLWGIFLSLFLAFLLKLLLRKPRPADSSNYGFLDIYGFPSIHAANAAMCSNCMTIIGSWLLVPAWIIFLTICWTRWKTNLHYIIDLVAGSVIGTFVALYLMFLY